MGLLKEFLTIDAERRSAHQSLRQETLHRRLRIEELSQEARRKRDEISVLDEELARLTSDMIRLEQDILDLEQRRDEYEHEAISRKAESLVRALESEAEGAQRFADEFRRLRASYTATRDRLLSMSDTSRLLESFHQLEKFLSDTGHPIPEAARAALQKERADLLVKIGPLVQPAPIPDSVCRTTIVYSAIDGRGARALAAIGLPPPAASPASHDVLSLLMLGAYASSVERLGNVAPVPTPVAGGSLFSFVPVSSQPAESAFELCLALDEGLRKAATSLQIRIETANLFIEPEIAEAVFLAP